MKGIDERRWREAVYLAQENTKKSLRDLSEEAGFNSFYLYTSLNKDTAPKAEMIRFIAIKSKVRTDWLFGLTNIRERERIG